MKTGVDKPYADTGLQAMRYIVVAFCCLPDAMLRRENKEGKDNKK